MNIFQELWYENIIPNEYKAIADKENELISMMIMAHTFLMLSVKVLLKLEIVGESKHLT